MNPFSSRYKSGNNIKIKLGMGLRDGLAAGNAFLSETARNKILTYIQHLCGTTKYLEPFVLETDDRKKRTYLKQSNINQASNALLGYQISDCFDPTELKWSRRDQDTLEYIYDDLVIMDLIEFLLVFCKKEHRQQIVSAFSDLFHNINLPARIFEWMIILDEVNTMSTVASLVKSQTLQAKLRSATASTIGVGSKDMEVSARVAADLTQLLYSSDQGKDKTKTYSEELITSAAELWVDEKGRKDFITLLNDLVKKIKELNNQISNVRHTDKHTMLVDGPVVYKMIYNMNIGISELALATTQSELISIDDPEIIKNSFSDRFDVDLKEESIISLTTDDGLVDFSDIPF